MRLLKALLHVIGFICTILLSVFQLALHLAISIMSIFAILLVKSNQ